MAKRHPEHDGDQFSRIGIALFLAWLVPGAGHLYMRKYFHAAVYFAVITILVIAGVMMQGEMHSYLRDNSSEGFLQGLAALGNIALGAYHLVLHGLGWAAGNIEVRSYEYGTTFIIIAALLNVLTVLDAFDHARGLRQ